MKKTRILVVDDEVIMLSARGDEQDKVRCLDLGADDYMTNPNY